MSAAKTCIVATAGHVDHGKSALVRALTGIDPDRLPEEKARGITTDLGFAHFRLPVAGAGSAELAVAMVDVPGHENFIKNMVAGVGGIDAALIVVAADDGWMPQTEEHVQILEYLGVAGAILALTKIDRCAEPESAVVAAIRERLRDTAFAAAPIVPTSVVDGRGLAELRAELSRVLAVLPPARDSGKPRLWVDRAFQLRGVGTVVTGTLSGGSLAGGMEVTVAPRGFVTRIRGLQQHGRAVDVAPAGARVAIQLADLAVAGGEARGSAASVGRGDVITGAGLGAATRTVDVWLERSPRAAAARQLAHGQLLRLHAGTAAAEARLVLATAAGLGAGQAEPAQLRLDRALPLFRGERFVLRDAAGRTTLAGGVVLDPAAHRKRFHRRSTLDHLERQHAALNDPGLAVAAALERDTALAVAERFTRSMFARGAVDDAAAALVRQGVAVQIGEWLVARAAWESLQAEARRLIAAHHARHPAQNGLPLAQLRMRLARGWVAPAMVAACVQTLVETDCEQSGAALKLRSHQPVLSPALDGAIAVVRGLLGAHPLDPPSGAELVRSPAQTEALRFLIKTGEVTAVGPQVVMLTRQFERARESVEAALRARGWATVSELRQVLGTSRRVAVPLLEALDRAGVTVRDGDRRRLRAVDAFAGSAEKAVQPAAGRNDGEPLPRSRLAG